jgi:hypothetical protein
MRLKSPAQRIAGVAEVFDDAVNCAGIVDYLNRNATWCEAKIGSGEGEADASHRDNSVTFINPYHLACPSILRDFAARVWHYLDDYAQRYDVRFSDMESINVNRYDPGQRYRPHADDGPGHNRIISALVYLNDVPEGGETEFIHHGVSVSPRQGRLIIFPSNYAYAHAAHPPASGIKYSAAFWTMK